tara:strand:+ start:215 stop:469 length:255 start_codon:yes stop_codon:yes gene_type:complete
MNKQNDLEAKMPSDYKTKRNIEDDNVLIKYFNKLVKLDTEGRTSECKRIIQAFNKDELKILWSFLEDEKKGAKSLKMLILNRID